MSRLSRVSGWLFALVSTASGCGDAAESDDGTPYEQALGVLKIEGEAGTLVGGARAEAQPQASGGAVAAYLDAPGRAVRFTNLPAATAISLRYATALPAARLALYINGAKSRDLSFPGTGGWGSGFRDLPVSVAIGAGSTVELRFEGASAAANIDYVELTTSSIGLGEKVEAEAATLLGSARREANPAASGGAQVAYLDAIGNGVRVTGAPASSQLRLRYATPLTQGKLGLFVNGVKAKDVPFPRTGSWTALADTVVAQSFPAGATVELRFEAGGGAVNLDTLTFGAAPAPTPTPPPPPPPTPTPFPAGLRAFPSAEGFGAKARGGRGGVVMEVTNLNEGGPGSFRAACEASGPRIVVFRVGGTIVLTRDIMIVNPYITIAGQTAPGDGIAVRGAALYTAANETVVRGLRFRVGDSTVGPAPGNRDGMGIDNWHGTGQSNVIIDHCSVTWAVDGNIDLCYKMNDVTIQWSIIAEGLHRSSNPEGGADGGHSTGLLVSEEAKTVSIHHNLFASNNGRNPLLKLDTSSEVINNVVYNWGNWEGTGIYGTGLLANVIGNYYKPGPDTPGTKGISVYWTDATSHVFLRGNVGPGRPTDTGDDWLVMSGETVARTNTPALPLSGVREVSAAQAYESVLAGAGATLPKRDSVDSRIVAGVRAGTGRRIDSQSEVGGWPVYVSGAAPADSDHDGMPDAWELSHGLNPSDPSDGRADRNGDGYTNVEEYLNGLLP